MYSRSPLKPGVDPGQKSTHSYLYFFWSPRVLADSKLPSAPARKYHLAARFRVPKVYGKPNIMVLDSDI